MDRVFYTSSDASHLAVAGCLFQLTDEGERRVIACTSSTLRGSQLRYTVNEKEMLAVIHCLRQWRILVLGRELVIYCDHKALSFALTCRLRSARLSRWILYLQEFDFTILHTPGKDNTVADVLSRFPAGRHGEVQPDKAKENEIRVMLTRVRTDYTGMRNIFRNTREHQLGDEVIRAKLKFLEEIRGMVPILSERELSVCTWYIVHDGLLFKRGDTLNPGFKLCVPTSQVQNLVMSVHVNEGHFGKAKVYNFLRQYLYWPRMQRHIRQIIASCDLCQKTKCCATTQGPLHSVLPRRPGELVCTDLIGPLPVSRGGTTYILVFVDAFTKYVKIYALKRATTKAILKRLLKDYVPEVQKPTCILSDNGTQFTSGLWVRTLKEYGIRAKFLSVYFPAGNVTERYNKEIGRMLRAYCHQQHTNWATILPFVESCMNKSINESTGYSATLLQFGTLGTHPLEEMINFPSADHDKQSLEQIWVLAHDRLMSKYKRRAEKHAQRTHPVILNVGDKVLLRTHPQSSALDKVTKKFFLLYEGPYTVSKQAGPNSYELTDGQGNVLPKQNIINLKLYKDPDLRLDEYNVMCGTRSVMYRTSNVMSCTSNVMFSFVVVYNM
nr:unnamed protein product [Callosobruchus chinensis]